MCPHVCTCVQSPEINLSCYSLGAHICVFKTGCFTGVWGLSTGLGWLVSEPRNLPSLFPLSWYYKHKPPGWLFMWVLEIKRRSPCLHGKQYWCRDFCPHTALLKALWLCFFCLFFNKNMVCLVNVGWSR